MQTPPVSPFPEVYVLWHPRSVHGEFLAKKIHRWLRLDNSAGIPVFFRSLPQPGAPPGGLPPELPSSPTGAPPPARPIDARPIQFVIALMDVPMIADPAWRIWLDEISSASQPFRQIVPVALDSSAFNAPGNIRGQNFLRPTGLHAGDSESATSREAMARSLLKQITEALCRSLLISQTIDPNRPGRSPAGIPKIRIFLSHAKTDGEGPAQRIREYIYGRTQLAAFFDENDIPFNSAFSSVLDSAIRSEETAALIAIRSANYASRPWCRRELATFRKPYPADGPGIKMGIWKLNPVLVVDALDDAGRTTGLPELGNAPIIRWSDGDQDQEEQIVTTLLRDALLGAYYAMIGESLVATGRVVINWNPDPTTLLQVSDVQNAYRTGLEVLYPGRALSGLDLDILSEFFPNFTFKSYEEVLG